MKYKIMGDDSHYHSGCAAVMQTLRGTLAGQGDFTEVEDDFDVLIVNGEGTMHHDTRGFQRKMEALSSAQSLGQQTYLINSVWQENSADFDDVLARLNGLSVRGIASARDLFSRHARSSSVALDLSFHAPVNSGERTADFAGAAITTDFYSREFKQFVWLSGAPVKDFPTLDLRTLTWSDAVNQIATASVIVAGRHHAMYAACRARTPFVAFDGNSHKFDDLLEWANSKIPICRRMSDIPVALTWARSNRGEYDRLFDWMESLPKWQGLQTSGGGYVYAGDDPDTHKRRAEAAEIISDWQEAASHWARVRARKETATNVQRHAVALARSGERYKSALILAKARWQFPDLAMEDAYVFQTIGGTRDKLAEDLPAYFDVYGEAKTALQAGSLAAFRTLAEKFLNTSGDDYPLAHTVLVSMIIAAQNFEIAGEILARPDNRPAELRLCEQFRLGLAQGLGSAAMLTLLGKIRKTKAWKGADVRAASYRYTWLVNGASRELLSEMEADTAAGFNRNFFLVASGIAAELDENDRLDGLVAAATKSMWQKAITLPIAVHIRSRGMKTDVKLNPEIDQKAALSQQLKINNQRFEAYIGDRNASIAVVGNAPSELGRRLGSQIDGHDIVVRFNIFDVSDAYSADYGSRIDTILTTEKVLEQIDSRLADQARYLVMTRNLALHSDPRLDLLLNNVSYGERYAYLPDEDRKYLYQKLSHGASAGLKFLYYLARLRGGMKNISTYGFAFTEPKASGSAHYFEQHTSSQRHNWPAEKKLFHQLLGR